MITVWKAGSFTSIWLLVGVPAMAILALVALSARTGQPHFLVCAIVWTPAIILANYSCIWLPFAVRGGSTMWLKSFPSMGAFTTSLFSEESPNGAIIALAKY